MVHLELNDSAQKPSECVILLHKILVIFFWYYLNLDATIGELKKTHSMFKELGLFPWEHFGNEFYKRKRLSISDSNASVFVFFKMFKSL